MNEKKLSDEIPHLVSAGFGTRIHIFTEIARHPDGLSVKEITEIVDCNKAGVWYHIKPLVESSLVSGRIMKRNGMKSKIFKATPMGVATVHQEIKQICTLYAAIYEDLVRTCSQK